MRFSGGVKQNGFPQRSEFLRFAGEKDFADSFRARCASWLAGLKDVNPGSPQPLGENRRLGRLPRTFAAFEGNELASGHELGLERAGVAAAAGCGGFLRSLVTACDT